MVSGMSKKFTQDQKDQIIKSKSIRAASRRRSATTAIIIFLLIALFLTGATWGTIAFIDANSMRIVIDKNNVGQISISEDRDFTKPSSVLRMRGPEEMDNITYNWIDKNSILGQEGNHHGENYIAYSFYVKNMGQSAILYGNSFVLTYTSQDIERAMRIMVIEDETTASCYAETRPSGSSEFISYDTDDINTQQPLPLEDNALDALLPHNIALPFEGENEDGEVVVFKSKDTFLDVGEIKKYTVIVWLEGSDSDCVNSIIGAKVNFEYNFYVTQVDAIKP